MLIAQAMELELGAAPSATSCAAALTKLAIKPPKGWQPARCATVDDLYVTAVRIMKLNVEQADDPARCAQALRDEGLAIDELLPARPPQGEPPVLLEAEVRAFLASGFAAPLATARRTSGD